MIVAPGLWTPTSPPTKLNAPPVTLPVADDSAIVPGLPPTRPPALLPAIRPIALPTVTFAAALDIVIVPMLAPGPKMPF